MQQQHLQQLIRRDIYVTCKILLLLFCIGTSYLTQSDYLVLIWKIFTVLVPLHDVKKNFKQESNFKQILVSFLPQKYDIISQLHHSYAKDPFCVMRLIYWFKWHTRLSNTKDINLQTRTLNDWLASMTCSILYTYVGSNGAPGSVIQ